MSLQPGTVINAQVLKVLANDMVRIAIANLSIEVMSEIPLQPGQTLQLAVSQMPEGIRLAVVGQGGSSSSAAQPAAAVTDTVTLAPDAPINAMTKPAAVSQSPANQLTALEALAVSAAAQTAATKQASMSQLFANLGTAAASDALPPLVQQAAMQLLARRPPLDAALSGDEIKTAFETSGLFLEKTLAIGAPSGTGGNAMPDLKAALVVFRQLLSAQLGDVPATGSPQPQATSPQGAMPHGSQTASPQIAAAGEPSHGAGFAQPPGGATLVPELDVQEILLPQARVPVADDFSEAGEVFRFVAPNLAAGTGAATAETRIALNLMQEALATSGEGTLPGVQARTAAIVDEAAFAHTNTPPPPIRDALPSPQPVAAATLAPRASASKPRAICCRIPMRRSRGRHCCKWRRCPIAQMRRHCATIRLAHAGISRFHSPRRLERLSRSSKSRATAAAMRSKPQNVSGARAFRWTSSPPVRCMRWCR